MFIEQQVGQVRSATTWITITNELHAMVDPLFPRQVQYRGWNNCRINLRLYKAHKPNLSAG